MKESLNQLRMASVAGVPAWGLLGAAVAAGQSTLQPVDPDNKDKKLGERLIRKVTTSANENMMDGVIRMMHEASRRLEIEFDAGSETQALQDTILARLDDAIKVAARQRRPRRRSQQPSEGDKRRMPKGQDRDSGKGSSSTNGKSDAPSTASGAQGSTADGKSGTGDIHELRRAWGHLPMREREEIIQGIGESFLERYREWIERYYRALQETED